MKNIRGILNLIEKKSFRLGLLMKNIRVILNLVDKKSFKLELLLLSTLVIISASVFVSAGIPYQRSLNVGNPAGPEASFTLATIMILLVSLIDSGLSLFSFRREAATHVSNTPRVGGSFPSGGASQSAPKDDWQKY